MADSTLSALTAASALDGTELFYAVQGGANTKATGAQIKTLTTDFSALSAAAAVADTDSLVVNQGAGNLKQTFTAVKTWVKGWIAKADVGLGNVDNTSDATKNAAAVSLTNKNLTSGTNTFPTFNQSTSGSAATLTTPRAIDGQNFDGSAAITVIGPGTHAATGKTTPVDADELPLVDSAASNVLKKLTWANLKATLKTYLDTLYAALDNSAWTSYTPTVTTSAGSMTYTSTGLYKITGNGSGKTLHIQDSVTVTSIAGSPTGNIFFTPPGGVSLTGTASLSGAANAAGPFISVVNVGGFGQFLVLNPPSIVVTTYYIGGTLPIA